MIDQQTINDFAEKISSILPEGAAALEADIKNNLKAAIEAALQQMNVVSREEFDVQSALLQRTLAKLEEMEKQIEELEKSL